MTDEKTFQKLITETDEKTLQKFITEYDAEDPGESRSLAKYLEDRLSEISSIKRSVFFVEKRKREERNRHESEMKKLDEKLIGIQKECLHISTTYHPDASGNNDSHTECNHCGAYAKRLKSDG